MHPLATQLLEAHYEAQGIEFNAARARMARIPEGASLIDNPVSTAPGFRIGNVHVMAGVPKIMQAMMENILPTLEGGEKLSSVTITAQVPEGAIASAMEKLQGDHPEVNIGLYPFYGADGAGVSVVARGRDLTALAEVETAVKQQFTDMGMPLIQRPPPAEFLKG
jgi:molybdopterin-biosynthesis enzyme MoeA-like protein